MSNPWFKFKQFIVHQDKCAMKVGTDAVLLGAWCDVENKKNALDIGTGTGILALMIAQRNASLNILGIDIDPSAIQQATANVTQSPFSHQITILQADITHTDISDLGPSPLFDLIISNPPFYDEKVFCPNDQRNNARHTSSLDFDDLISKASSLLHHDGTFSVIIPTNAIQNFISICSIHNLYLHRRTDIFTTPTKMPKRTMLEFTKTNQPTTNENLYMRNEDNSFSAEYIKLTKDFYL